jgi:hypothetical protein
VLRDIIFVRSPFFGKGISFPHIGLETAGLHSMTMQQRITLTHMCFKMPSSARHIECISLIHAGATMRHIVAAITSITIFMYTISPYRPRTRVSDDPKAMEKLFLSVPDPVSARSNLQSITSYDHMAGTDGCRKAALFLSKKLKSALDTPGSGVQVRGVCRIFFQNCKRKCLTYFLCVCVCVWLYACIQCTTYLIT